jgi:hypothetical protein
MAGKMALAAMLKASITSQAIFSFLRATASTTAMADMRRVVTLAMFSSCFSLALGLM